MDPELRNVDFIQAVPDRVRGPQQHEFHELIAVLNGNYQVVIDQQRYLVSGGEMVFIPAGVYHEPQLKADLSVRYYVVQWMGHHPAATPGRLVDPHGQLLNSITWLWRSFPVSDDPVEQNIAKCLFALVVMECQRQNASTATLRTTDDAVNVAVNYMERDYHRDVSLDELAVAVGLSVPQFVRRFKKAMHITPARYLRMLRVDKAKSLLRHSGMSRQAIAEKVGLKSASHLSKLLRQ